MSPPVFALYRIHPDAEATNALQGLPQKNSSKNPKIRGLFEQFLYVMNQQEGLGGQLFTLKGLIYF